MVLASLQTLLKSERDQDGLHRALAAGGWFDLFDLGAQAGGSGSIDTSVAALEQLGVNLVQLSTIVVCGFVVPLLRQLGQVPAISGLLAGVESGDMVAVPIPVVSADPIGYAFESSLSSEPTGDDYYVWGKVGRILNLSNASRVLLPVECDDGELRLAIIPGDEQGMDFIARDSIVPGLTWSSIEIAKLKVSSDAMVRVPPATSLQRAGMSWSLVLDGYCVGMCGVLLEQATEYATVRRQFGKPIGAFQAVQHMIADMCIEHETSRSLLLATARQTGMDVDDSIQRALVSRLYCDDAAKHACELAIQVHGAAGFSWDVGLHRWYRSALLIRQLLSDRSGIRRALTKYLLSDAEQKLVR